MQYREKGIDLFDDPPWSPTGDPPRRGRLARTLRATLAVSAILVGSVVVVVAFVAVPFAILDLHFGSFGSFGGGITLPSPSSDGLDIALSPDGSRAYVTEPSTDRLLVFSTVTGAVVASIAVGPGPSGVAVSPDGTQVWVVNTGLTGSSSGSAGSAGAAGAAGSALALGLNGGTVSVISTATNAVIGTVPVGVGPIDVAFSPDGHTAYVTDHGFLSSGSVSVIDTSTLTVTGTLDPLWTSLGHQPPFSPTSVSVTPDGQQVWVSEVDQVDDQDGTVGAPDSVYVFDAASHAQLAAITVGRGPFFMALSRDGRDAYVADKLSCDVRTIDTATDRVVATVRWPSRHGCPFGLAAGADDDVVFTVTGDDHTINLGAEGDSFGSVNVATSHVVADNVGADPVTMAVTGDGRTAYVVDADLPEIDVVDTTTGSITSRWALPRS